MNEGKRISIITGHYGSGKTEFAVNYVLKASIKGAKTAIVDLDIVNPYFRSRELEPLFDKYGVKTIASSIKAPAVEVPALSPEIFTVLQDEEYQVVFDIGGDKAGATVLARYHKYLDETPYEMFFVINANRPMTSSAEAAVNYLRSIEEASGQRITSLVNNTHLCGATTLADVIKGQELCENVCRQTGLPVKYTLIDKSLLKGKIVNEIKNEIFPLDIYLKKPWEI